MGKTNLLDLIETLPPVMARSEVGRLLGGVVAPGTLANEDSRGTGPRGRFLIGRRVVYKTDELLSWLQKRLVAIESDD